MTSIDSSTRTLRVVLSGSTLFAWLTCAVVAHAQTPPAPTEPPPSEAAPAESVPEAAPPASETAPPVSDAAPPPVVAPPAPPALTVPPPAAPLPPPGGHGEKMKYDAPKDDVTSLSASGGGALNGGNTNSYQVNLGADFQLIRQPHGFAANAAFAYGVADVPNDENDDLEPIVRNLNARARYDYFLTELDAIFLATAFRWDPFAGIDRRNQGQIGYLRYLYRADKHRFWGELGYDLTSDDYGPVEGEPDAMIPDPEEEIIHSVRLFFGYENAINTALSYLGGLEGLLNVEAPEDSRINFSNAIRSSIGGNFALELKLTFAFDNAARLREAKKLDTTVLINLIYQLI